MAAAEKRQYRMRVTLDTRQVVTGRVIDLTDRELEKEVGALREMLDGHQLRHLVLDTDQGVVVVVGERVLAVEWGRQGAS